MSVLIKGMEMPTSCYDCNCFIRDSDGSDYCCLLMQDIEDNNKRDDNCPLVPVPPHGRLIDADALLDDLLFPSKQFEQGMRELIGDAPTVVPAEEAPAKDTNAPTGPYDLLYEEGGANTT